MSIRKKPEVVLKYDEYLKSAPVIRVLLLEDIKRAEIEIGYPYRISNIDDNNIVFAQGINLPKSRIYMKSGEFWIEPIVSPDISKAYVSSIKVNGKVGITSQGDSGFIKLNNSKYQGKLLLIPQKKERFTVLEEIGIEEYLPGVVGSEIPAKWQDEAILTQVVAARSYAVYQKKIKSNSNFHIGKLGLAYNGSYTDQLKIKEIVKKSRGIVMVYDWGILPGYFHSTCGGHTEDANLVFGLKSIPPLSGVSCGYCGKSKYYRWENGIKKDVIERKLHNYKFDIKHIYDIVAEKNGPGGHSSAIKVKYSGGTKSFNANEFRLMIGPNLLRSTAFKVKNNGDSLIFEGKGWGHGVGLCQYGMQDMAKSGLKWIDILKYYYPGIELIKIY